MERAEVAAKEMEGEHSAKAERLKKTQEMVCGPIRSERVVKYLSCIGMAEQDALHIVKRLG